MAALGISVLTSPPYPNPVHSSHQYHSLSGYRFPQPPGSLSHPPRLESRAQLERGGPAPCPPSLRQSIERDSEHMSRTSSVSAPTTDDALLRSETHAFLDKKRPRVEDESPVEGRDAVRPRPLSWNPSAPVEPPLKSTQLRPIGVQSILNPLAKSGSATAAGSEAGREGLGDQISVRPSHQRLPSSPTVHLPSPSLHAQRLSASPGMRNRQMSTPLSPSARFVNAGAGHPGKLGASQSPLAHESRPGLYSGTPTTSPMPLETVPGQTHPVPAHQQPVSMSVHSTPTFHSRRTSAVPTPNPSPQETSPTTPISAFSQFGRSSPSLAGMSTGPPPAPAFMASSSFTAKDAVPRLPSVVAGTRHVGDDAVTAATAMTTTTTAGGGLGGPQTENAPLPGMIPCILDLKSGSSSQAEKRKANSDASRRFRNRKRNEMQMEHKITAQQEAIRQKDDTIRILIQERDQYRSERDFYREQVSRLGPSGQASSSRPASPQAFRASVENPPSDRDHWHGIDAMRRVGDLPAGPRSASNTSPLASTRMAGSWSSASSQYPPSAANHAERGLLADEHQAKPVSQYAGTWTRS